MTFGISSSDEPPECPMLPVSIQQLRCLLLRDILNGMYKAPAPQKSELISDERYGPAPIDPAVAPQNCAIDFCEYCMLLPAAQDGPRVLGIDTDISKVCILIR